MIYATQVLDSPLDVPFYWGEKADTFKVYDFDEGRWQRVPENWKIVRVTLQEFMSSKEWSKILDEVVKVIPPNGVTGVVYCPAVYHQIGKDVEIILSTRLGLLHNDNASIFDEVNFEGWETLDNPKEVLKRIRADDEEGLIQRMKAR